MSLDPRSFRKALGSFASGVTVITAIDPRVDLPVGVTVSAFSSLSLDPPLVLFCLGQTGSCVSAIEAAGRFAVNILADDQRDLSARFAGPVEDRWRDLAWEALPGGAPALPGALTVLGCTVTRTVPGGDHLIFIGEVETIRSREGARPLIYHGGAYLDLP
ncbi:flavin reductase family protein [Magnetospirillum fulvum]|uniref:NADH-FMN oxidoreductase RutF, flavin reductase (DIM6/NTAB) family n=1 Tax=Magnetospirillum fulvum TaxID=1082 RepID=A0A1H6HMD8_MAGFU|nr:flavin reductase family protein [Magnetospirillum fulvum]SEH36987.1 NADH-FMN oxidoreductase RutF, flavin reductase (DIM6/NTAB) family [Magnetospirillum fulvum]